ncbi:intraflagellar transport protein [Histomonas meleagridis]|uniref:intraflagellar transport protein 80-like n=1 Tax=Histomonas meleagridis TaxID=135588 RepID=UPI0035597BED|nr:intraflagellar transport protein [Histomonas meleagridis]KAH0799972.1 intraflagellar transport protein 80-like [Histomonas meleagridis]
MKIQVLSKTDASSLTGLNGMVAALCHDDKYFYSAVDGGAIRKYLMNSDDLPQTSDDIFTLKKSHITCLDCTHDQGAPNTFFIGCSDGNFHLCSSNWRIEKTVQAHNGGITCLCVNPDGASIASAGEDGIIKIWSRNGILRSTLASCGAAVTSMNWDCTGKYLMFTHGGMITVRSASFKQDQTQFRGHRRLITCSDWNKATNEIITGSEDRIARIFDPDGRMIVESAQFDYAVTTVRFLSSIKLILIGTAHHLYLTDLQLRIINTLPLASGAAICVMDDQPRAIVGGNGTLSLISIIGKKAFYRDCEVFMESPKKLIVYDLKNGITENLQFSTSVVDFYLAFDHLIVVLQNKIHIYKSSQWSTPSIVDTKETARALLQSQTIFVYITVAGAQVIGYDGRPISRINDSRIKWDLLSLDLVSLSPCVLAVVSPDDRKHVFAFSASTGQMITAEPLNHPSEIKNIRTNQATTQNKARIGLLNSNGDLTICRFVSANSRSMTIESQKLANFIDEFQWHTSHDVILARSDKTLTVWCCPNAIFFTPELMPMLKTELRLLFDVSEITSFDGTHAFVTSKDGSLCVAPISPYLIMVHEAIDIHKNWKLVLQICRSANDQSLWAVCAACAIQSGEIDAAQESYAVLSLIDKVMFLEKVKKMQSPAARNAMIAVLQGRVNEAEGILLQGRCIFRAIKLNIELGRWEHALDIAKTHNKYVEVVAAYRTKFLKDMDMEETDQNFIKIGQVDMESIKDVLKKVKSEENE